MGRHTPEYRLIEMDNYGSPHFQRSSHSKDYGIEKLHDVSILQSNYLGTSRLISYFLVICSIMIWVLVVIDLIFTSRIAQGNSLWAVEALPLISGSCNSSLHNYSVGAHFFINFLGTLVLGSSNYLQQVCSSPDYHEITRQLKKWGDVSFGSNSLASIFRTENKSLKLLWLSLILSSLPIHIMLNGVIGYSVHPVTNASLSEAVATTHNVEPPNQVPISAAECVNYLISSCTYVTAYDNMTVILHPNAPELLVDEYTGFASGVCDPWFAPKVTDIATCYIHPVDSKCDLTIHWFPLLSTAISVSLKSIIAFIAVRRHSHFQKRVFNSLGDMIALGAR